MINEWLIGKGMDESDNGLDWRRSTVPQFVWRDSEKPGKPQLDYVSESRYKPEPSEKEAEMPATDRDILWCYSKQKSTKFRHWTPHHPVKHNLYRHALFI